MQSTWKIRVAAERTHVAWMVGAMQSAIAIELSKRVIRGGLVAVANLDRTNPMLLLDSLPSGYLGALEHPDPARIAPQSWYFDLYTREQVYRVLMDDAFVTNLAGPARIRFLLKGHYSLPGDAKTLSGIGLVALDEYGWIEPDE